MMEENLLDPLEEKTLSEKLFLLRFRVDGESHLILNKEALLQPPVPRYESKRKAG